MQGRFFICRESEEIIFSQSQQRKNKTNSAMFSELNNANKMYELFRINALTGILLNKTKYESI